MGNWFANTVCVLLTGFDVACVLLGTAAHLTDTDDAIGCLRGINHALAPGGIAVLELEHPYDLFEGQLMDAQGTSFFLFTYFDLFPVWGTVMTSCYFYSQETRGIGKWTE